MHPDFDPQPTLNGDDLRLRPLAADDLEPLYSVARDPEVWAGHPARNRHERPVFEPYFDKLLQSRGTLAVTLARDGQVIGCSRYYPAPDEPQGIAIGYTFLGRDWWGGAVNFAMKRLMLEHAFASVDRIWLHIDPTNIRSQKATAKLGARMVGEANLRLGGADGLWQSWRLEAADWRALCAASVRARPDGR